MKQRMTDAIRVILMIGISVMCLTLLYKYEGKAHIPSQIDPTLKGDTIPEFCNQPASEGLKEALIYYDLYHPDIVYAQAVLETGHFTSDGCLRDNNLFGLYNSWTRKYHRFGHWTESVVAYKEWIQRRYKPPADYYTFLKRIGYATDPLYITKLKQIVKNEERRSIGESSTDSTSLCTP